MQITFNSTNFFKPNYKGVNVNNTPSLNFKGKPTQLTSLATESFNSETAMKFYSKIKKYLQLIGNGGRIESVKVLNEKSRYYEKMAQYPAGFDSEANIFLSINKTRETANITLSRKYNDVTNDGYVIFNADFDANGQMIYGKFPPEGLRFERSGNNVRRIYRDKKIYMPVTGNDKAWEHSGRELLAGDYRVCANDDSNKGAFELFLELARLRTSIYK